jgi:hypothetical protein
MIEEILLYEHLPPLVSLVEYPQLVNVVAHLDNANDDVANNTEEDKHNYHAQFGLVCKICSVAWSRKVDKRKTGWKLTVLIKC